MTGSKRYRSGSGTNEPFPFRISKEVFTMAKMKSNEFVEKLIDIAKNYKTLYVIDRKSVV